MPATTTRETEVYEDDDVEEDDLLLEDEAEKEFDPSGNYTSMELEEWGDKLLRADSNRELCRKCKDKDKTGKLLPYGEETGMIESVPQFSGDGSPILDDEENQLYLDFPELKCEKGHRWFQGEGQRRDIRGPNPILFESHLYNRKRREIYVEAGTPDPAFTMDRKGRPTQGMYNRSHPEGRKINTKSQRAKNGASYYRVCTWPLWMYVASFSHSPLILIASLVVACVLNIYHRLEALEAQVSDHASVVNTHRIIG
jgi:hypothetical protein